MKGCLQLRKKLPSSFDIRTRTALGLAEQFNLDLAQADRVANSAKTLIDQYPHWQKPHLADEMKNLLIWAARLLEVGIVINHRNVQKHSAYILQNMELPGIDQSRFSHYWLRDQPAPNLS